MQKMNLPKYSLAPSDKMPNN